MHVQAAAMPAEAGGVVVNDFRPASAADEKRWPRDMTSPPTAARERFIITEHRVRRALPL